jgi:hypothetical protein
MTVKHLGKGIYAVLDEHGRVSSYTGTGGIKEFERELRSVLTHPIASSILDEAINKAIENGDIKIDASKH